MIAASSVVLPAPLGPITVTIVPGVHLERNAVHRLDLAVRLTESCERRATWSFDHRAWRAPSTPPRYASSTSGLRWISAGSPSAELLAEIHHDQAIGQSHDEVHVVLDQQDGHALPLERAQKVRQLSLLAISQSGRRLVEQQQQHGIGGERARDLDDPLLAERQAARRVERVLAEADPRDRARRVPRACALPRHDRGEAQRATPDVPRR